MKKKQAEINMERNSMFYEMRLKETVSDGSFYIPELLIAILKKLEQIYDKKN